MEIKNNTYCGRCGHKGMLRETRRVIGDDKIDVLYSCLNPKCEKVEVTCVDDRGNRTKRPKGRLGLTFTVSKTFVEKTYYSEEDSFIGEER